ncbi:MAG: TolC family protein [Phycisphaerales bacterium]|nr:TolC family protein [Phycisphaerales bacterium]MCI0631684.1 TolC family protein [Phycisphaerales bacterium]MCI0677018.1 TolC family protein [Phycisphaerales bacterium]
MLQTATQTSVVLLAMLGGCASMKPGLGFDDVANSVSERSGARVHWNTGSQADAQVNAAIQSMLEQELTADEAVQIALLNNRDLQAVYEDLNIAQADLVQAGLLRNPIFSGEVRFATSGGGTGAVLDVAQDFVSLLWLPLRQARAEAAFEAAKVRVTAAVLDTAFATRLAFYDYQAAEQTREMRATVLEATSASYDLAKRLREAGNNRDLDVANERALYEQSKVNLAATEALAINLRERLNVLMGLWGAQTQWGTATRLPELPDQEQPTDGIERQAIQASLDLSILRRQTEVAARALGIARPLGWLDDAEIGVAAEREVEGGWSVGPSLALPIPLFDQGQASVGRAQAQLRQAAERYIARAVEIRSRVRAAQSAVLSAYDRARYYQHIILPLRQRIVEETQLQYNAMQVSPFELLQAKRDQINTGAEYIMALRDYWQARAGFDHILRGRMTPFERTSMTSDPAHGTPDSRADGEH